MDQSFAGADRPFFTTRESLDDIQSWARNQVTSPGQMPPIYPDANSTGSRRRGLDDSIADEDVSHDFLRDSLETLITLLEQVAPGIRGSVLILDEDGVPLHYGAETHELAPSCSKPILDVDGSVLGTFAMFYDKREPTAADLALADSVALLARNLIKRAHSAMSLHRRTETAERLAIALEQSETRFRQLAETIPVQVWTATPEGLLDYVTTRTSRHFGRMSEELLGQRWTEIVHPDDIERASARWNHALETGEPYEAEFRMLSADGEYRWHLVRADPMRDSDGLIVEWFGCTTDIEEQKRLYTALDRALVDAKQANKAKADFLAMMSHELRTPLNSIGGYTQLMLDGIPSPATDGQENFLRRIAKSQQHLLGLIESVLTHAKLEAGKVTYRITDVVAHEILDVIDPLTAPLRAAKQISYDCNGCDSSIRFRADKDKVVQIMLNLLSNAVKFTPAEGSITVSTAVAAPELVAFSVRDTGIGMSPDQLSIVFEPFVQFDSKLSRESNGTGLGMPISRELARGMGGDLVATSEPGAGSTFTLSLPAG